MRINNKDIIILFEEFKGEINKYSDLNLSEIKFQKKPLEDLAKFPALTRYSGKAELNSFEYKKLPEKDKLNYIAKITGTTENNQTQGYVSKEKLNSNQISKSKIVSWTRINLSNFFVQESPVCTNDDSFVMEPNDNAYYKYIAVASKLAVSNSDYNWTKKAGKEVVKKVEILVPEGSVKYDTYTIQKIIFEFIMFIEKKNEEILKKLEKVIGDIKLTNDFLLSSAYSKDLYLSNHFNKWNQKYEIQLDDFVFEEELLEEVATFPNLPTYSASNDIEIREFDNLTEEKNKYVAKITGTMENNQISGYVLKEKLDANQISSENVVSWTRINLSEFFLQEKPVCTSDDSFVFVAKEDYYFKYLAYAANLSVINTNYDWSKKAGKGVVKKIKVKIPKSSKGISSLELQRIFVEFLEYHYNINNVLLSKIRLVEENIKLYNIQFQKALFLSIY